MIKNTDTTVLLRSLQKTPRNHAGKAKKKRPPDAGRFLNLARLLLGVFFTEALDPTSGINQLLLAGVKWVAS